MNRFASLLLILLALVGPAPASAGDSAALTTYKRFANAFIYGRFDEARALSIKAARATVDRKEALVRAGEAVPAILEPEFMVFSETPSKDGRQVEIHAVQVVLLDTDDPKLSAPLLHQQSVVVVKDGGGWKVAYFMDDLEKCCVAGVE